MTYRNRKLGPYLLQETISVSDRATLFRAVNPKPGGGDFGIRILNNPDEPMDARLLLHEYHSHNALKGRFTPQVVGIYRGEGALVYRWITGVSLQRVIEGHLNRYIELNIKSAVEIILQLATALADLHTHPEAQRPPIYGRLNPEHVLLTRLGTTVILGMGRQLYNPDKNYRSPEQAAVAFVDWRSDQWSLGALMVELLLQEKLYNNRSDLQAALLEGDVRHWTEAIKLKWPDLGVIVTKMLSANAGDRYTDERELIQSLRQAHQKLEGRVRCRAICEKLLHNPIPPQTKIPKASAEKERPRMNLTPSTLEITEPYPINPDLGHNRKRNSRKSHAKPNTVAKSQPQKESDMVATSNSTDERLDWDETPDMEISEWDMALPTAEVYASDNSENLEFDYNYTPPAPAVPTWLFALNFILLIVFSLLALMHLSRIFQNVF